MGEARFLRGDKQHAGAEALQRRALALDGPALGADDAELGCEIDGRAGVIGSTIQRRLDASGLTFFLVSCDFPHRIWLAVTSGRWNFILQFRRPASSTLLEGSRTVAELPQAPPRGMR